VLAAAIFGFMRGISSGPGASTQDAAAAERVPFGRTLATAIIWLMIWLLPLLAIAWAYGRDHVLSQIAVFFSKLAIVTFGGAYAVLAYMREAVPRDLDWGLTKLEMVDALGLAETTPGPLILVTQFVGYLAALRKGGGDPMLMGALGALVTTWATFAPCFLWIFVGAPYVERLHSEPRLKAALAAVTAAVVGVILNLTVTFAIDVLSPSAKEHWLGPLKLYLPDIFALSWPAVVLSALALVMTFRLHRSIFETLGLCGALGLLWHFVR
jgi:chromate transporter